MTASISPEAAARAAALRKAAAQTGNQSGLDSTLRNLAERIEQGRL